MDREAELMTALDMLCWLSLLFFAWFQLWVHVYYLDDEG